MIERENRKELGRLLRHLVAGQITNDEFENKLPKPGSDRAVSAIQGAAWGLYDDLSEHKLTGSRRVGKTDREIAARCILFLQTDLEYQWPVMNQLLRLFMFAPLNLITFGFLGYIERQMLRRIGDYDVWPFIRRENYDNARANPKFLAGAG